MPRENKTSKSKRSLLRIRIFAGYELIGSQYLLVHDIAHYQGSPDRSVGGNGHVSVSYTHPHVLRLARDSHVQLTVGERISI